MLLQSKSPLTSTAAIKKNQGYSFMRRNIIPGRIRLDFMTCIGRFLAFILILSCCACGDTSHKGEYADQSPPFDSIKWLKDHIAAKAWKKNTALYNTLVNKLPKGIAEKLYHSHKEIADFERYIKKIRTEFLFSCGADSEGPVPAENREKKELTNAYFFDPPATDLLRRLNNVKYALLLLVPQGLLHDKIESLGMIDSDDPWQEYHFRGITPVEALGILSKFEQKIESLEIEVLTEYLK